MQARALINEYQQLLDSNYQLALRTPGSNPFSAISRNVMRDSPKCLIYPRGRPVVRSRLRTRLGLASRGSIANSSLACARSCCGLLMSCAIARNSARRPEYRSTVSLRRSFFAFEDSLATLPLPLSRISCLLCRGINHETGIHYDLKLPSAVSRNARRAFPSVQVAEVPRRLSAPL